MGGGGADARSVQTVEEIKRTGVWLSDILMKEIYMSSAITVAGAAE